MLNLISCQKTTPNYHYSFFFSGKVSKELFYLFLMSEFYTLKSTLNCDFNRFLYVLLRFYRQVQHIYKQGDVRWR